MARSTGPILAIGAITLFNESIVHDKDVDWRIPIGTGLAAMGFAFAERLWERPAVGLAFVALVSALFVRLDPQVPSPIESFADWYRK